MKRSDIDLRWLFALIVALGLVVGLVLWQARTPDEPPAPAAPTAPAPLPADTGIDGAGLTVPGPQAAPDGLPADPEQPPAEVQVQPEAGAPATMVETPDEGIGGEVYVSSPAFKGKQRLNAGFYYPSGTIHGAWDIGINRGTHVYAAKDATVVGTNDGVRNHPSGSQYAVSNSPSNWVLNCATVNGKPAVLYYQHLSPGLAVKRGQKVAAGQYLGKSGNTGNSTGDHLHLSSSYSPWSCASITKSRAEYLRYEYLRTASRRIFAPAKWWATAPAKPVLPAVSAAAIASGCRRDGSAHNLHLVRVAVGGNPIDGCGPAMRRAYAKYQRSLGFRGAAANGIPGPYTLTKLGRSHGFRVVL